MSFGFRDASFLTASENDDLDEVVDEGADHMTNASRLQHADQIMHFSLTIVHRKGRKSRQYNQSPLIVCPSRPAFHQSSLGPSSGTSHVGGTNEGQEAGAAPNGSKPTKGTISPAAAATTALADSFVPALFLGDLFIPSSSVGLFHSQPAFQLLMHQPDKHNLLSNDLDSTLAIATKNFDTEVPLCSSKHSLAIVSYSDSEDDSETIDTLAEALDLVSKSGGTPGGTSRGATDSMTPHDGGTPGNTPSGTPDSTARVAPGVATSPNASKSAEGGAADNYPKPEPNSNPNMHLLSKIRGAAQGGLRTLRGGAKDKVFPSPPVDSETGTDTETGTETGSEEMDTEEYMLEQIKEGENKTPLFVIRGVELKLSFGDGQKMLLRPAFLSMGQVYKVVDVCKDVLKKAWLKGRHDARISTLHQVQDLAAKLSGLDAGRSYSGGGPASTAAVVSDSPSENGEDDDGMGEPPEAKELMRELGESGTKRMANVTFHNVLDDIISPPKPEGVLEVVNTLVFGTISAFGQSLCTVADVADSVVINTMLGMLMLVGLPRSLNLVAGHLEDFGTEMAIRNLLRSGLKTSQANHGCLSTNGGHGATPPVLSHPTTPASMGAPVLPTPGGSTVPPASSDGTAALPKPTGSDPSRVTSAVADKVADNVAEVVAGQKQDQTTERSGNQIPASTNTNSPPTGPPTPNPDEVDITMEVQPTLSTLLERMELQDHLQNELQQQKQQLLTGQHALSKVQVLLEQQLLTEKQSILEETQGLLKKQYHLLVERLELKAKQQEQQRQQKQLESLTGLSMMWQLGWLALAEMRLDGGLSANQLLPLLGNAAHFPLALDDLSLQITFKSARVEAPTGGGPLAGKDKAGKGKTTTDETTTEVGLDISCRDLFGLFEYQKPADSAGPKPAEALTAAPGSAPPPPSPNTTKASARSPTTSAAKDASELDDAMEGLIIIGNLGLEKEVEDSWWSPPSMGFANLAPLLARHANKHGSS